MNSVWKDLIKVVVKSQRQYYNSTLDQLNWLSDNLYDIYINDLVTEDVKYHILVLMNRNNSIGRYSLYFNSLVEDITKKSCSSKQEDAKLYSKLKILCESVVKTNLETKDVSNYYSSIIKLDSKFWIDQINKELLTLSLYVDRKSYSSRTDIEICHNEVCVFQTDIDAQYINTDSSHIVTISYEDEKFMNVCLIRELDLMFIILSKGVNPYTNKKLDVTFFKKRYHDVLKICAAEYVKGYRHRYVF